MEVKTWQVNIFFFIYLLMISLMVLDYSNYGIAIAIGKSMCPDGAKFSILLEKDITNINQIEIGKVYTFRRITNNKSQFVQHRCIEQFPDIYNNYYIFKGDNNNFTEYVHEDAILKKTLFELPIMLCTEEDINHHDQSPIQNPYLDIPLI